MSVVNVSAVGQESLDRAAKLLAGIDGGIEKALRDAMSRTTSLLRKNSVAAVREKYAISAANVRANENVKVHYSYRDGVQAEVNFYGRKIPLYRYDGAAPARPSYDTSKWVRVPIKGEMMWVHPGLPAWGHQLRNTSPVRFNGAFVAQMDSGHTGIFERTGGRTSDGSDEIKEIMGSSVPEMLGSREVEEKLANEAVSKFEERLDHNVMAILSGCWR